jgi:hypothetical protein
MRAPLVACAALLAAAAVGCSGSAAGPPVIAIATSQASGSATQLVDREPPPELLLIVPPAGKNLRLLAQAARTFTLCQALAEIHGLRQPKPDDAASQLAFAYAYSNVLSLVDPSSAIPNPYSRQQNARMYIPAGIIRAMDVARRSMYAYWIRLGYAQSLGQHGGINAATLNSLLHYYFVELVNSRFSAADQALVSVNRLYCHQGV